LRDSSDSRSGFSSIKQGGLRMTSLPMRLFNKGNRLFWDPANIDFSRDAEDWAKLTDDEREVALLLAAEFLAGEESVTQDIQPFMSAMAAEGRLEDEMYLTQFAFEEAKHVEAFRMWLDAVGETGDLQPLLEENPTYGHIFYELLPNALNALEKDPSPAAQVRAAVTYNQVIEGVLAMTGYHAWRRTIELRGLLPGMQEIVRLIARDERRHMAWGTYTCRRHIAADHSNWQVFEETINALLGPAMQLVQFLFDQFEAEGRPIPFDLDRAEFESFAMQQFSRRIEVIEAAKGKSVAEIEHDTEDEQVEAELEAIDLAGSPEPIG
jgi:ribonucleoside-diphosphate reductase beta chain